ncbi:hypothetical protein Lalb_Chr02g0148141 [Lupinus albus]|uniref:Uncharacterized protein n=1 Tax=Lupinus albus TaxID=3870 RepID=A0A6A4R0I0_LUPAL|nr:hypothetical protein Lalb_Chr02g0148141 [Lupinus albus]
MKVSYFEKTLPCSKTQQCSILQTRLYAIICMFLLSGTLYGLQISFLIINPECLVLIN